MKHKREKYQTVLNVKMNDGKILLFLMALFIILTTTVILGTREYKEKHVNFIYDSMNTFAKNNKIQFEQFIDNKVEVLEGLTQYPEIYEMDAKIQREFIKGYSKKFGFSHIFIVDIQGNGYYFDDNRYINQSDEQFYQDIIDNDIFVTQPFFTENGIITTVSVSIYYNDKKKGMLCGAVRLDELASMFAEYIIPMDGKLFLVNREGTYIVANDFDKVNNMMSIYEEKNADVSLIEQAFLDKSDKFGILKFDGTEYVTNVTYLEDFDWVIGQCINSEYVYKEMKLLDLWRISSFIIIVLIMCCVIKIVLSWYQSMNKINTDALTKCNSRTFIQKLIEDLESDYKENIAIVYFDLNKFKQVNDVYGHDEGDRILIIFSNILVSEFKGVAQIGRMGGDEFIAVAANADIQKIDAIANGVNIKLQEKRAELSLPYEISTSFGYAVREKGSKMLLEDVMKEADKNMYKYKEAVHKQDKQ